MSSEGKRVEYEADFCPASEIERLEKLAEERLDELRRTQKVSDLRANEVERLQGERDRHAQAVTSLSAEVERLRGALKRIAEDETDIAWVNRNAEAIEIARAAFADEREPA